MKNTPRSVSTPLQPNIPLIADSFERIMSTVFDQTHIVIPPEARRSAYTIRVDKTIDLHFFPDADGNINIVGNGDRLPAPVSQECLLQLLALNTFSPVSPNVSVGVDRRNESVQVWVRQQMHEVEEKGAIRLLKLMTNAIGQVNEMLACKHAPRPRSRNALPHRN